MKQIPLTRGLVALVDDEDYEWLSQRTWCAIPRNYCKHKRDGSPLVCYAGTTKHVRNPITGKPSSETIYMHNVILNKYYNHISSHQNKLVCDHINRDTLDNTKDNLQIITKVENNKRRLPYQKYIRPPKPSLKGLIIPDTPNCIIREDGKLFNNCYSAAKYLYDVEGIRNDLPRPKALNRLSTRIFITLKKDFKCFGLHYWYIHERDS